MLWYTEKSLNGYKIWEKYRFCQYYQIYLCRINN